MWDILSELMVSAYNPDDGKREMARTGQSLRGNTS